MTARVRAGMVLVLAMSGACRGKKDAAATADTSAAATASTNPSCTAVDESEGGPVVRVELDADAAKLERLQINAVRDPGRPLRATLQASAGEVECATGGTLIRFSLRGQQTSMALTVHAPADSVFVAVQGGGAYGGQQYPATGTQEDLLWGEQLRESIRRSRGLR